MTPKGLRISIKQEKKRVLGMFGGGDNSKVLLMTSEEQAKVSHQSMQPVSVARMSNKEHGTHITQQQHPLPPQHSSTFQHTTQTPPQAGFRRGLFGVIGKVGAGVTKLSRDVAQGITKQVSGSDSATANYNKTDSRRSVEVNHPVSDCSEQHSNIVPSSRLIQVSSEDPIIKVWYCSNNYTHFVFAAAFRPTVACYAYYLNLTAACFYNTSVF